MLRNKIAAKFLGVIDDEFLSGRNVFGYLPFHFAIGYGAFGF